MDGGFHQMLGFSGRFSSAVLSEWKELGPSVVDLRCVCDDCRHWLG